MEHWIEHPLEPQELILAWQAPAEISDRVRWAVGRLWIDASGPVFDYFDDEEFALNNLGRTRAQLQQAGYAGYPAFDFKKRPSGGYREHALEAFLRRLPPPTRSDFGQYLAYFKLRPDMGMSPMSLLAATEARLPSDGFSLIDPLKPEDRCVDLVFEIAGFRHEDRSLAKIAVGDVMTLRPDPDNYHDPAAVCVLVGETVIGYVNRLQAKTVSAWLQTRATQGWIARLNGRPTAPRAFGFLQVRSAREARAA